MRAVCGGLRVIDFSWGMAGGIATMVLADNGAEVIKVEPPTGDPFRHLPAFRQWHRGKKSLVLDLKTAYGKHTAQSLAATADVVTESFRPGVADRLGIGYEELLTNNPGLVYCSITGFGESGAYAQYKAYEGVVQAKAGRMSWFGGQLDRPGPAFAAVPVASFGASQLALQGILAALYVREKTGHGQKVHTSLLHAVGCYDMFNWAIGQLRERFPKDFPALRSLGPSYHYLVAVTKDGHWIQFANAGQRQFRAFLRAVEMEEVFEAVGAGDQRMVFQATTFEELWELLLLKIQERSLAEWMDIFLADPDISVEPIRDTQSAMEHPQMLHNGHVIEIEDPEVGKIKELGPLVQLAATPSQIGGSSPELGRDAGMLPLQGRSSAAILPNTSKPPKHALDGVTILELASFYAGPFGTSLLADLGARVIKIEPLDGDPMRVSENALKTTQGKESICLDLKRQQGKEIFYRLAEKADLLMHTYRAGVAERLGIDYGTLKQINPNLVYLYASAYGSSGPFVHRPAYHPTFGAISGGAAYQAGDGTPPTPGQDMPMEDVRRISRCLSKANEGNPDPTSALVAGTALLMGLLARQRTGKGQYVGRTMLCSNAYANSDDFIEFKGKRPRKPVDPGCYGLGALYRLYRCRQGWIFLACLTGDEWERLCRAVDYSELSVDGRFSNAESRVRHDSELVAILEEVFLRRTATQWEEDLTDHDLGCVVADGGEYWIFFNTDPHVDANCMAVEVDHPKWGTYRRHTPNVQMSLTPGVAGPGNRAGEHSRQILEELGYSATQIDDLGLTSIVAWPGGAAAPLVGGADSGVR